MAGEGPRSPVRQKRKGVGLRKQVPEGSIANIHHEITLRQNPVTGEAMCDKQGGRRRSKGGSLGKREGAVERLLIHGGVVHASGWS